MGSLNSCFLVDFEDETCFLIERTLYMMAGFTDWPSEVYLDNNAA